MKKKIKNEKFYSLLKDVESELYKNDKNLEDINNEVFKEFRENISLKEDSDNNTKDVSYILTIKNLHFSDEEPVEFYGDKTLYSINKIKLESNRFDSKKGYIVRSENIPRTISSTNNIFSELIVGPTDDSNIFPLQTITDENNIKIVNNKIQKLDSNGKITAENEVKDITLNLYDFGSKISIEKSKNVSLHFLPKDNFSIENISIEKSENVSLFFEHNTPSIIKELYIKDSVLENFDFNFELFFSNDKDKNKNEIHEFYYDGYIGSPFFKRSVGCRSRIESFEKEPFNGYRFFKKMQRYFDKKGDTITAYEMYVQSLEYYRKSKYVKNTLSSESIILWFSSIISGHRTNIIRVFLWIILIALISALIFLLKIPDLSISDFFNVASHNLNVFDVNPYIKAENKFLSASDVLRRLIMVGLFYEFVVTMRRFVKK